MIGRQFQRRNVLHPRLPVIQQPLQGRPLQVLSLPGRVVGVLDRQRLERRGPPRPQRLIQQGHFADQRPSDQSSEMM